jgi:RNA polymerase sigma factor (sigma-70 family)
MSKADADEPSLVRAAQRGDQRARDTLVHRYLPLVYNIVGRALSGHPNIDDVVQETMLRVVRDLPALRNPESFRSWVGAIAVHQISTHRRHLDETARHTAALAEIPEPTVDFEELAVLHLRLSGQRREVAEASGWLDEEDRTVLSLWWLEAAGEMTRGEVTAALETTAAYTAVRIQRMRNQLDLSRSVVAALAASHCTELGLATAGWDSRPSALWRKRIARHVRDCAVCLETSRERIAAERLLVGCGLVPVPAALLARMTGLTGATGTTAGGGTQSLPTAKGSRVFRVIRGEPAMTAAVAAVVIALAVACTTALRDQPQKAAQAIAAPSVQAGAAPPSATATIAVTTAAASPSKTRATATATAPAKAAVPANPAPSHAGCGTGLADIWADWPMPNPSGTGLPHPASYTNLGNGTVRDNVTCLVWQRTPAPSTYTFSQAKTYCAGLTLAGGGWHLPSRIELMSIVDTAESGPAIDSAAFPGTPAQFFWTSSPWAVTKTPLRAWVINFYEGMESNAAFETGTYQVRCVQSADGTEMPDYQIADGMVTDPATGLTWQRSTSSATMSATAATTYCAALNLGGYSWRLPSEKELATLVDETRVSPAIDVSAFPDTAPDVWYWSSTIASPNPTERWALNYNDGFAYFRSSSSTSYVRCVS